MKSLAVIFSTVLIMMSTTCLALELGIKAGLHNPTGDYGDYVDSGFTIGGQISSLINDFFSVGAHMAYNKTDYNFNDADVQMIEFYPYADLYPLRTDKASIFIRTGIGINAWDIDYDDGVDLMIVGGVGMNFLQHLEILALYNRVFEDHDDVDYFSFTIGYNFDLKHGLFH